MHLLAMNGCNKVSLRDLPNGLDDEVMGGSAEFSIPNLALNYIYKPSDPAIIAKFPNLAFLPSESDAK